jgi:putative Holliday junction resolvase
MKALGVDLGESRTGLAVSDPGGIISRPLGVIREKDEAKLARSIVDRAAEEEAQVIVVGLPRPLSGGRNTQLADVSAFVERLRGASALPVETWDERFTSRLAERGRPRNDSHDAVAACYILQGYLDARTKDQRERLTR